MASGFGRNRLEFQLGCGLASRAAGGLSRQRCIRIFKPIISDERHVYNRDPSNTAILKETYREERFSVDMRWFRSCVALLNLVGFCAAKLR